MAHTHKCTFIAQITAPFTAGNADEAIIGAFDFFQDSMERSEDVEETWLKHCAVGEVSTRVRSVHVCGTELRTGHPQCLARWG